MSGGDDLLPNRVAKHVALPWSWETIGRRVWYEW
jgi:hypothetical protein